MRVFRLLVRSLVSCSLVLSAGCLSPASFDIPAPPSLPQAANNTPPPSESDIPIVPASFEYSLPALPAGRMQTVDDVWKDWFVNNATPEAFPFGVDKLVVAVVPEATPGVRRISLLAAFLAAGYRVKDAGLFKQSNFLVDNHPWWTYAGEGFLRKALEEGRVPAGVPPTPDQEPRTYRGFEGMKLEILDPTSLWVPDLLANQNLRSDYLARVLDLEFVDGTSDLTLSRQFNESEVKRYRSDIEALNKRIDEHNDRVVRYNAQVASYEASYERYLVDYENWRRGEVNNQEQQYEAYKTRFEAWRSRNADALASARESRAKEASYRTTPEERPPLSGIPPAAKKASLPSVERMTHIDTTQLDALMKSEQTEQVGTRYGQVTMEVIDAKTGEVVWVTRAEGVVRDTWSEDRLLKEIVRRVTRPD